jgi:D-alanyl-D-alanine carboxypeptidase/D-alanyl-D-alanine-endopeptidase (penicillin-binding protein 4)
MRNGIVRAAWSSAAARVCIVTTVLLAAPALWAPNLPAANLPSELEAIRRSPHLKGSSFGLTVYSVNRHRFICSVGGDRPLVPASNQKLLVTAAALMELGPNFTFTTGIYAAGPLKNGLLRGDLYLRGGGDPNLSGRFNDGDVLQVVDTWVRAVRDAGIRGITGRLVIDDSLFDTQFFHPSWPRNQRSRWYSAAVGALSLNDSCVNLTVKPTSLGSPAAFEFEPYTPYLTVHNSCKTVSGRKTDNIVISRDDTEIYLGGTIGAKSRGYSAGVAVKDPGLFTGEVFRDRLRMAGIRPSGVVRVENPPDYRELRPVMEYHSQDLATTIKVTNAQSQNFYANTLLKYLGARRFGQGSFENGSAAVRAILGGRGLLSDAVVIDDGCGLSHKNRITTANLVMVLDGMYKSDYRDVFVKSLATPGDPDGTLKRRLNGERHGADIYAKSGYVNRVKALSGYVLRDDGEVLIFSFIVNNYSPGSAWEVNNLQNRLMRCLSDCVMD